MKGRSIMLVAGLSVAGGAEAVLENTAAEAMMRKDGCAACHEVDKKLVGPPFVDVAAKYRGDPKAAAMLKDKVKKGGAHVWGEAAMPPNVAVSDAEIDQLVDWILTLKK